MEEETGAGEGLGEDGVYWRAGESGAVSGAVRVLDAQTRAIRGRCLPLSPAAPWDGHWGGERGWERGWEGGRGREWERWEWEGEGGGEREQEQEREWERESGGERGRGGLKGAGVGWPSVGC
jgi:hypothetical protein